MKEFNINTMCCGGDYHFIFDELADVSLIKDKIIGVTEHAINNNIMIASFNYYLREGNKKTLINQPLNIHNILESSQYKIGLLVHKDLIDDVREGNDCLWKERLLLRSLLRKAKYHHYDVGIGSVKNIALLDFVASSDAYHLYNGVANTLGYLLKYHDREHSTMHHNKPNYSQSVGIVVVSSNLDLLRKCLASISEINYDNVCVHVVWYGEQVPTEINCIKSAHKIKVHQRYYSDGFNFAKVNNEIVAEYCGDLDYVVLMNDDIEVLSNDWLKNMVHISKTENAEIVGASLYFPGKYISPHNGTGITYQHAGVKLGNSTTLFEHVNYKKPVSKNYVSSREVSAVTFAMVLIVVPIYKMLKGMDHKFYGDCNDIEFCLRARELGCKIWYCARAEAIHHESATRKTSPDMQNDSSSRDFYNENIDRLKKEFIL